MILRVSLVFTFTLCLVAAHAASGVTGRASSVSGNHKASIGQLILLHAWTAATDDENTFVYMDIDNGRSEQITLLGATSNIAEDVELVGFQLKSGSATYTSLPLLPIAAGAEMNLRPQAAAFRMNGLTTSLQEGDEFTLRISFDIGEVAMMVQVEREGATEHSHAGHKH